MQRRTFLKAAAVAGAPLILPKMGRGDEAPNSLINIGFIGCGRIAQSHLQSLAFEKTARITAFCDLDSRRLAQMVENLRGFNAAAADGVKRYHTHHELLADKSIDAVLVATPDHQHAPVAVDAALAGKDIYVEKPISLTLADGRALSDVVRSRKRILQVGSQQRSLKQFARACELVRNGRIGRLRTIEIGLPEDTPGGRATPMPVPENLDYDRWLGPVQPLAYTEDRVHPQKGYGRPGWLRCEDFTCGMITGWGSHHIDIAHWAMGLDESGPVEITAKTTFLKGGLWNVHGPFDVTLRYANGVEVHVGSQRTVGVRFQGENGWIFVSREDVKLPSVDDEKPAILRALDASDREILKRDPKDGEVHLVRKPDHHGDWLACIRSRQQPIAPVEVGHRSCSACVLSHIAMKLGRTLKWDPARERFLDAPDADAMLSRPARPEFSIEKSLKDANFVKQL